MPLSQIIQRHQEEAERLENRQTVTHTHTHVCFENSFDLKCVKIVRSAVLHRIPNT